MTPPDPAAEPSRVDPVASAAGRALGRRSTGGARYSASLSPGELSERGRRAVRVRWARWRAEEEAVLLRELAKVMATSPVGYLAISARRKDDRRRETAERLAKRRAVVMVTLREGGIRVFPSKVNPSSA